MVFVNTKCKELDFDGAEEKANIALDLHIEDLQLEDFDQTHRNLSKKEIIGVLEDLEERAKEYSEKLTLSENKKKNLMISIVWIGYSLDPDLDAHSKLINQKVQRSLSEFQNPDKSKLFNRYVLTSDG